MTARTTGVSEELPEFPFPGTSYRGPDPIFTRLRADRPVVRVRWSGGGHAWLVTRHEDIRAVLDDTRFSRAASYAPDAPKFSGLFQAPPGMIISLDPPDHTRLRVLAEQAFSPARIAGMRPRVRELAGRLLDALEKEPADGPVDLVEGFAAPLAMGVICELLGVPEKDRDQFLTWVRQFADVSGPEELAVEGRENLGAYIAGLVAGKQAQPADDVLSDLITARDGEDRLGFEELVGLGYTLLGGGFDSAAGQISNFVLTLLDRHLDVWARLGEHPEDVPAALEELLRTVNLTGNDTSGLPRIATEDVTIGGTTIPAGDAVFLSFASANRDSAVFADPEAVDFGRADNPHLAFGYGIHHCLGAPLARVELAVALEELTRRFPGARLAVPESELLWRAGDVNHNLVSLPVHLSKNTASESTVSRSTV
ncbi:cytochrome P450 [Streptomyces antnestii]|uniref:Cytochrome P450 n=1 Tax=Streptomyces antnestii TaxID=2494256 RepID=A0A3S2VSB1_9ACTN|nr:cytochrome P450 [Streptomyces sp. San01]RVU16054.1 cytochrome P450 [Streptomyces sp. San01]